MEILGDNKTIMCGWKHVISCTHPEISDRTNNSKIYELLKKYSALNYCTVLNIICYGLNIICVLVFQRIKR